MKKLMLLLGLLAMFAFKSPPPIVGQWEPIDEDRVAINELITFTSDSLLVWSTGIFITVQEARWKYTYANDSIVITNSNYRFKLPISIDKGFLVFNNRVYQRKKR